MIRFLHTADWQLGKPFGQFPDALSGRLTAARVDAVERIADIARERGIAHVIVAGDVWDSEQPSPDAVAQPVEIMARAPGVHWWLIPGNHDPARPHGLWSRLPDHSNITWLTTPQAREMEPGAWLLPAPWTSRNPGRDLSDAFTRMETPDGVLRIGVAHGSTADFKGEAQTSTIAADRASVSDLDYLALGDWHGVVQVGPRTWYSGTPEPDRFPRNRPGVVLDVTVAKDREPTVEEVPTAEHHWLRVTHDVVAGEDVAAMLDAAIADAPARRTLLRVELNGALPRAQTESLAAKLDELRGRLAHLRERGALRTLWEPEDLDRLDLSGSVRVAAEALRDEGTETSEMALALLFDIAGELDIQSNGAAQ